MPPRLSVIIPTHRRVDALAACLDSLAPQLSPTGDFEVLIVDDGSPQADHERLWEILETQHGAQPIILWRQDNAGPARARNEAVLRAQAPLVLFLNDDVTLDPGHLAAHLDAHAKAPEEHVAFRGLTRWADDTPDTPVMRWMRNHTFRYDWDLYHPIEHHFVHFATCDLSLKRSLCLEFPFDETFSIPSGEDTDMGLRLLRAGRLELHLLPEARTWHHHLHTYRAFRRRARMQGRACAMLLQRHPELEFRLRGGYHNLVSLDERVRCALEAFRRRDFQAYLSDVNDIHYLRQLDRHHPRPPHDGGPYPQRLLAALEPENPALGSL